MSTDLIISGMVNTLAVQDRPEYKTMLQNIQSRMPAIQRDSSNFYKPHSQFMLVTLDITAITPVRAVKHTLAEIDQTQSALQETYIKLRKTNVDLKKKQNELDNPSHPLSIYDKELLEIEIIEIQSSLETTQKYVNAAVRKLNFLVNQHKQLLEKAGKEFITEEDYEREEARYHIMTCMKQALIAARSRGGVIDEGNFIYLFDLGISAAQAQLEVYTYLSIEEQLLKENKSPPHEMTLRWLEACADKFQNDSQTFAERRGFSVLDTESLTNRISYEGK